MTLTLLTPSVLPPPTGAPDAAPAEVLAALVEGQRRGRRGVLATITGLSGTGARAVGTHMAVFDDGGSAGSFSSGCVEAAIVAEALNALHAGEVRSLRFGQGSPFIDIKLPCGGGMDVLFVPDPATAVLAEALARLKRREPVRLWLQPTGPEPLSIRPMASALPGAIAVDHRPPLRVMLLGQGAEMLTSLKLARSLRLDVALFSPDEATVAAGVDNGIAATLLHAASDPPAVKGDRWTACLFLFHDHEWEPPLLARALAGETLWIGAMGSRRTHAARQEALAARGVPPAAIARVRGPVGLIERSRDPATLALSALAEIMGVYAAAPA